MMELASRLTCTGCGACVDACGRSALGMKLDDEGFAVPCIDRSRCVECGACRRACPVLSPAEKVSYPGLPSAWAGWSSRQEMRDRSSSGGVFGELAAQVIVQGGWVAGVRVDGVSVCHDLADTVDGVRAFVGSKYLQSEPRAIYKRVLALLREGRRVLFSGTPCQVAAMSNLAEQRGVRGALVTCDVACLGVPSRRLWQRYLDEARPGADQIVSFRDKQDGWLRSYAVTLSTKSSGRMSRQTYEEGDLFLRAYAGGLVMRNSCYECRFAEWPRSSDLTLADFWGMRSFPGERQAGVSLVLSNSPRGVELLRSTPSLVRRSVDWAEALSSNPRLYEGRSQMARRAFGGRRYLAVALQHGSTAVLRKLYTGRIPRWQFWWWPYKGALRRCEARVARSGQALARLIPRSSSDRGVCT